MNFFQSGSMYVVQKNLGIVQSLLFIGAGAGAGEKNSRSRSKTDRLRNTGYRTSFLLLEDWRWTGLVLTWELDSSCLRSLSPSFLSSMASGTW